jgi:hypothetical protein
MALRFGGRFREVVFRATTRGQSRCLREPRSSKERTGSGESRAPAACQEQTRHAERLHERRQRRRPPRDSCRRSSRSKARSDPRGGGTRRWRPQADDTTPCTAARHSARLRVSTRWKRQLLETRDARRNEQQERRQPSHSRPRDLLRIRALLVAWESPDAKFPRDDAGNLPRHQTHILDARNYGSVRVLAEAIGRRRMDNIDCAS